MSMLMLLHSEGGYWDEIILLAAGVLIAVAILKLTSRNVSNEDDGGTSLGPNLPSPKDAQDDSATSDLPR